MRICGSRSDVCSSYLRPLVVAPDTPIGRHDGGEPGFGPVEEGPIRPRAGFACPRQDGMGGQIAVTERDAEFGELAPGDTPLQPLADLDRKSTRLNSSH